VGNALLDLEELVLHFLLAKSRYLDDDRHLWNSSSEHHHRLWQEPKSKLDCLNGAEIREEVEEEPYGKLHAVIVVCLKTVSAIWENLLDELAYVRDVGHEDREDV